MKYMNRPTPLNKAAQIAEDQWGLVTRRQLEQAGVAPTSLERLTAPGSVLERVAHGVYRLVGTPEPDHLELRAAWLQLAPAMPAWERQEGQGVVSHRSAAAMYGIGHLPADRHEFTVEGRKQTRRPDVRLHRRKLESGSWIVLRGLPVTRPSRTASDLLYDNEDPQSVAQVIVEAIRPVYDYPGTFADQLASHASKFGLRRGDGIALLRWMLELIGDPDTGLWLNEAQRQRSDKQELVAPSVTEERVEVPIS